MAFSFKRLFQKTEAKSIPLVPIDGECKELCDLYAEYHFRVLAFKGCLNLIANAIGKCEMKQFVRGQPVKGAEWYLWNVSPNKNQNASAFWHKLIYKAYKDGEALIVSEPYGQGVVVADRFWVDDEKPVYVYRDIHIGKRKIERLNENDVLYIRPNHDNVAPLIEKMGDSFLKLMSAAMQNFQFNAGQHWKVHVDQIFNADDEWRQGFQEVMDKQVTPFLNSTSSVLPEMDGYTFTQVSGGGKASDLSTKELREMYQAIWTETGRALLIPQALTGGNQQDTTDANRQFLSDVIDPLARLIEQEVNRKRYTREQFLNGDRLRMDTSAIMHFDIFANAANVEKIIGSGLKSVNEIRELIGDAPVPEDWADKHFMTLNIGTVDPEGGESK